MKRAVILFATALLLVVGFAHGQQKNPTAKLQLAQCALKVGGMSCDGCAGMVQKGLLKLDGVKSAKVDFKTGAADVEFDAKITNAEKIVAAFNQSNRGFRVESVPPKTKQNQPPRSN
ncbi:MAG: heavy-metal-associated domain-containing protein [Acidobacteriales bacterium]|nr:heavy-metal-associated domain-containing protein [Terriglobales bacterium]